MSKELDAKKLMDTLKKCVNEYKKQDRECSPDDIIAFYDPKLKKFLVDNKDVIDILFTMSFEQYFKKWVCSEVWKNIDKRTRKKYNL